MGRPKKPAKLLEANGSHLSKDELRARLESELDVDLCNISPPSYINGAMADDFMEIAAKLAHVDAHLFTELDIDVLARYLIAKSNYLRLSALLNAELVKKVPDTDAISKITRSHNAAFNQCQTCASSLGLTITSRCKILIPKEQEAQAENRFARFAK